MAYPAGLPARLRRDWRAPWTLRARNNPLFRSWLHRHGYLTPNFRKSEAACKDGTPVPRSLERGARNHAFNLEKLRHALGDQPVRITSWYRTPAHNARIGGARYSMHMKAVATDHPSQWVSARGRSRVLAAANRIFASGGMGTYPDGSVHTDTRGWRSRWTSYRRT